MITFKKVSFSKKSFKYFICYKNKKEVRPLLKMIPKMSAYRRNFDGTKYMSFFIKDDELLEKHNRIWNKLSNSVKKAFENEPVYKKKYLKIKIKPSDGKINKNFCDNEIPKEGSHCICLSLILLILYLV